MCGIVGYVGGRPCKGILFEGLRKLEYRGYDSAGIGVVADGRVEISRSVGNLDNLELILSQVDDAGTTGIAHTRWATHGRPSIENAHPHTDCSGRFAIVLNGIVENYQELRAALQGEGHVFSSETDAEVVAHLIERAYRGSLQDAVVEAYRQMEGHFSYCAVTADEPEVIIGIRKETPLVVGVSEGENFIASAIPAFLAETRSVLFPDDGEVVVVSRDSVRVCTLEGDPVDRPAKTVDWDDEAAEKAGYETFMLKEIYEQPAALADTLAERIAPDGRVVLEGLGLTQEDFRGLERVIIVACGTSYHAGLIGRHALERWARLPVEVEVASEFRYRDPVIGPRCLCIGISQSGETADTLAAMRLARRRGAKVLALTNIVGSQATREADGVLFTRAGLEVGVAATKTFLTQVLAVLLFALHMGEKRGYLEAERVLGLTGKLRRIPTRLREYLESDAVRGVEQAAVRCASQRFFMVLGRNIGLPVALEGALKLKEISYVPTEAYAAGEMKHGPIALLEEGSPVLVVATDASIYDKLVSNVQEVRARGARVIAVASEGNEGIGEMADDIFLVPCTDEMLSPLFGVVPLQLFAYYVAKARGEKVDQPRNLAKTVTVE
ncbi:MAG: glutamine--fructose-6-phosphate transaminase (isomerizing) [Actinobacteria bacterium]|mgnify:CR=1 FL=1|nr:glutamine--fructose-6-phosphate transaminase (isomerizing) [Actinomycetota bacterium]